MKNASASQKAKPIVHDGNWPLTGIANARPETIAAGKPRVDVSKLPFDPKDFIKKLPDWEGAEWDKAE